MSPTKNDIPEQRKPTPQPEPLGNTHQFYPLHKILAAQALDDEAASSVSRGYSVNTRAELGARPYSIEGLSGGFADIRTRSCAS